MPHTSVVVVGAGQAGLAMSRCLTALQIEHVVLERGAVAQRWRAHGWDSLRLLTPNWMTRLPAYEYRGDDPDGFMAVSELVTFLEGYAKTFDAPVLTHTPVRRVARHSGAFHVSTDSATWSADAVVIATGYCDQPAIPSVARALARDISQVVPADYRNPEQLRPGGVLIVGASATGVQLADEIRRSGRRVIIAAGRHTRLPRRYRGQDILWWLDRLGVLQQDAAAVYDVHASRDQPSLQLVGRPDHATVDLATLRSLGVQVTGRLADVRGTRVSFADDLIATTAAADLKLAALMMRIDTFIDAQGLAAPRADALIPTWPIADAPVTALDLRAERVETVIWATGYRRSYAWLDLPVLDERGEIRHQRGVTPSAGLYVIGLNFQRRRNSSFIDGVGADARELAQTIASMLGRQRIA